MAFGKKIQIFLVDGTPNGRWICELSNWTGIAYKIPRNRIQESEERKELSSTGVYFLFGRNEVEERPLIYVGEAENVFVRLKQHLDKKDNWNEVVLFISKDSNMNKAHIKYLEHRFYSIAKEVDRYSVDNSTIPTKSAISEAEQAELEEFIQNAKVLVNVLGHKVFESYAEKSLCGADKDMVFYVSAGSGKAKGIQTAGGFLLLKGSDRHINSATSLSENIKKNLLNSKKNGEIVNNVLKVDKLFPGSSSAAAFAAW